jgi:hypothetical protein
MMLGNRKMSDIVDDTTLDANFLAENLKKTIDTIEQESVCGDVRNETIPEYARLLTKQSRDCNFQKELTLLITKYRMGEDSNLESYALASYLMACVRAFNFTYQYTNLVEDEESDD